LIDIAIDGTGQMYGFDVIGDNAYKIDKATGASVLLGSIGFDANYAQGMCWDPASDVIYLTAYNVSTSSGELRIFDKETGNTALVGSLTGEIDAFAFPGTPPTWMNIAPETGIIPPMSSQDVTIILDGGLVPPQKNFTLTGDIALTSNPDVGTITIPVTFYIITDTAILTVTPSNQDVTVEAGTTTFAVANTGTGTMNYSAAVTSGSDWLTITSGGTGVNSGTIEVAYTANTSTSPRIGTITVTAPDATGSPVEVTVAQAGIILPEATLAIANISDIHPGPVTIPVHAENLMNLGSFQFTIEYDPAILTYTSVTNWHNGINDVIVGNPSSGHLTFVWAASLEGINIPDGNFFDLNFNWLAADGISTNLTWSDNPTPREFADYNGNIFVPQYENGVESGFGVGISEKDPSSIMLFPNPAYECLNIQAPGTIRSIKMINYLGISVYENHDLQNKTVRINTSNLKAGSYTIEITLKDCNPVNRKVIITK
jgi:hypothetical protein